ncbi:MAG: MFS transporter [Bacteroidales bacterium]
MAHRKTAPEDVVPFVQKLAFGSGHLANQLFPAALGVFMVVLVLALKMDPFLAGLLGAIPRLIDALTDPVMGYISDNTRSRWGRRKPYIFLGSVIAGISFMVMWQLYPENSQTYNFFFFLSLSIVFYLGYTIFATPLIGLGYEMTPDYNERTRLMAVSQWVGQMAWVIAPWFWVIIYNQSLYDSAPQGARNLSIWVGALCMLLGIMPALACRERILPDNDQVRLSIKEMGKEVKDFFHNIIKTFTNGPFIRLCAATFFVFNGFQTVAQFAFFIIIFYLFNGDTSAAGTWPAWFGTVSALSTAFIVIPIITYIAQKIGKKKAFILSTVISMAGYALKWWAFNPSNPWLMFLPLPLISFGIGGLFTLMMSMTADVCDLDELNTGQRREGMFGAVYWWMVKLGTAMALLTSGAVLNLVGFDKDATVQTVHTITQLRIADIVIPIVAGVLAIIVIRKYDLTEEKANEIRKQLISLRGRVRYSNGEAAAAPDSLAIETVQEK